MFQHVKKKNLKNNSENRYALSSNIARSRHFRWLDSLCGSRLISASLRSSCLLWLWSPRLSAFFRTSSYPQCKVKFAERTSKARWPKQEKVRGPKSRAEKVGVTEGIQSAEEGRSTLWYARLRKIFGSALLIIEEYDSFPLLIKLRKSLL